MVVRSLPEWECAARLGGLGWWCMRRSASLSLGFTASLAGPLAHLPAWAGGHAGLAASIFYAGVRFGFSCLANFVPWNSQNSRDLIPEIFQISGEAAAKFAKHYASSTSQKFSKQVLLFYWPRRKIYKRCFCSVSSAPAASSYS